MSQQADVAQQRARIAEQEAAKARAEAELQEQHAQLHEQGMADDQLIAPDERERFAGTSAVPDDEEGSGDQEGAASGDQRQTTPAQAEAPAAEREVR
jgi:hypothetical protein